MLNINILRISAYLVVALTFGFSVKAGSGYLAKTGPSPLRFATPVKTIAKAPTTATPVSYPQTTVEPATEPTPFIYLPNPLEVMMNASSSPRDTQPVIENQTNTVGGVTQPDEVVSPQMLLKYFNKSGTGNTTGVYAPLNFAPPKAAEPPSSKATYGHAP